MVQFGGKPSRRCQVCKSRKIRCDLAPGGCGPCKKAGRECPGYKDAVDVMFRDESQHVVQKAKKVAADRRRRLLDQFQSPAASSVASDPGYSLSYNGSPSHESAMVLTPDLDSPVPMPSSPSYKILLPSIDDQAMAFFSAHHVVGSWHLPGSLSRPNCNALDSSAKALGLAGLSSWTRDPEMQNEFRKHYMTAIQDVNSALGSPETAVEDHTLASILLLSQCEALESCHKKSLAAWEAHIHGAATILKIRGVERLKTPLERRLFTQAISSLMAISIKTGIDLPDHLYDLAAVATSNVDRDNPGYRMFELNLRATRFYSVARQADIGLKSIITQAIDLDNSAMDVFSSGDTAWQYQIVPVDQSAGRGIVDHYHIYDNFLSATIWNGTRSTRLLLNDIIRKCILQLPPGSADDGYLAGYNKALENLQDMQMAILASVPQHLGFNSMSAQSPTGIDFLQSVPRSPANPWFLWSGWSNVSGALFNPPELTASADIPLMRAFGGYALPWSLFLVGSMDVTSGPVRNLAFQTLKHMGSSMGIQQCLIMADYIARDFDL